MSQSCLQYTSFDLRIPATMDKMGYGNWAVWMAMTVLLPVLTVDVIAQPGFLSIDCGGNMNYNDKNDIAWVTDANYIDVGQTADLGSASQQDYRFYLHNLRFFPKPLTKSCYQLPVAPNVPYLLRLWFAAGNYSGFTQRFAFSVETLDMLAMENVIISYPNATYYEEILVSSDRVLYICLIRTSESDDPFINAIELRTLQDGMYEQAKPGTMLHSVSRTDVGGQSTIRFPQDRFDRMWTPHINPDTSNFIQNVNSQKLISFANTKNLPPPAVMQTAWILNSESFEFSLGTTYVDQRLLLLYFAEIEKLNISESRSFYVRINGERRSDIISVAPNSSVLERTILLNVTDFNFQLVKASKSTSRPIINAYEYYLLIDTQRATYSQDIEALHAIKSSFDIKVWISDPCYVLPWDGIGCDDSSLAIRISELNLSGKNLSGSVCEDIAQLTALINVSLDNNLLNGTLPNLSSLTMLERLHLQNNNLSGAVPEWLSELKNLKELFVENNNFSGVIPAQLLDRPSLKLRYSGNPYLCIRVHSGKCIQEIQESTNNSRKEKVSAVLPVTISAGLIICLGLVGIALYRKKVSPKHHSNEDFSTIMVPDRTISRAFTLQEIMASTQNLNMKIGHGGFGSVFFGKLPEGKDIAVKVLSSFSQQGVHQFQNEIDLLSRVHHKNLVSLLGYCNESRELMLIYEHMSGGSLRDRLYGRKAGLSELNWKTRLTISLDAAQGLEYLHMGCTPKIIHRDVKTANILLDGNMNGKLADFGLSKMTIDGEASHVTTVVKGTIGYLDPEYFRRQILTEKSDVYSFGVVLLEIICGRPPINPNLSEEEPDLIQWATPYVEKTDENPTEIEKIIDERLAGNYNMKSIIGVAKLALRCVEGKPSCRPSMREVVAEIEKAATDENNGCLPISERSGPISSRMDWSGSEDMKWSDNSCNLTQVGR